MKHYYTGLALGLVALRATSAYAQVAQVGVSEKLTASSGAVTYLRLDQQATPQLLAQSSSLLRNLLALSPNDELRKGVTKTDALGYTSEWHHQYYKGVPVEDGVYIVHAKAGRIETMGGELRKITTLAAVPLLSEKQALAKGLAVIGAKSYRWQIPAEEQWLRKLQKDSTATFYPKAELLVTQDNAKPVQARLAFKFVIYAVRPASAQYVYVDARNGEVFRRHSVLQACFGPTQGTASVRPAKKPNSPISVRQVNDDLTAPAFRYTALQYNRKITTQYVGFYRLGENGRHATGGCGNYPINSINTRNILGQSNYSGSIEFKDQDNKWTQAEYHNANKDDAALDAHWGAEMTTDYF